MHRRTLLTIALLTGWAGLAVAQTPDTASTPVQPAAKQVQKSVQTEEQAQAAVAARTGRRFVDADADGVCDNCTGQGQGRAAARGGQGRGPGDGTGNQGVGPRDGSGRGARSGACDGSGPKGRGRRGGRR